MNLRRKRLRLMRDTQWRGYARTAEGNPITLSQVRSLANLSVLGNSIQDGTPSPDNPVEVVGSGERTGNLFDISQITSKNGGYVDNNKIYIKNYSFTSGISPQKFLEMTGLQIGDTFTCRAQYTQMQDYSSGARYVNFIPKRSGLIGLTLFDYSSSSDKNNGFRVSTIPSDFNNDNYHGLYFYGGNISTPVESEIRATWNNFAIYKGSYTTETLPSYEPYGYKIPIMAQEVENKKQINIYTTQPLHGVGETHDTVLLDFDNKKAQLTKQYEYFKVNETQWSRASDTYDGESTTDRYHMYTGIYSGSLRIADSKCNILSRYNDALWTEDIQGFTWNSAQLHLRINNDVLGINTSDTAEERTSKFTSYTQNNDIYVLGKLINTTTTDITALQDWDTMPQLTGTWILTANGGTEPTLTAEYYSNERSTE